MVKTLALVLLVGVQLTLISALTSDQEAYRSQLVRIPASGNQRALKDYYWSPYAMSWYDAQSYCDASDLKFLTDDTPIEHNIIRDVLDRGEGFNGWTGDAWIGGRYFPGDAAWFWNARAGAKDKIIWNNWYTTGTGCATISNSAGASYGKWNARSCGNAYMFFCESKDN